MNKLINYETGYTNNNLTDSINPLPVIDLAGVIIPPIPFIWYREEETYCPIEAIFRVNFLQMMLLLDCFNSSKTLLNWNLKYYNVVIQRNVLEGKNLYISYHSHAYYLCKDDGADKLVIPSSFNKDFRFKCYSEDLLCNLDFSNNGSNLKDSGWTQGSVFIHDKAFSPPGHFSFTAKQDTDFSVLFNIGYSDEILDSKVGTLFIIINSTGKKAVRTDEILREAFSNLRDNYLKSIITNV